jgi:hypothetical protein
MLLLKLLLLLRTETPNINCNSNLLKSGVNLRQMLAQIETIEEALLDIPLEELRHCT